MLYLDQRGTGLSTPVSAATLALQGDVHRQADYLKLFRADSIVKDCEAIRRTLTEDYPEPLKKWSKSEVLGSKIPYSSLSQSSLLLSHCLTLRETMLQP